MPDPFGSFSWICSHTTLPQCNLFFTQLWNRSPPPLTRLFPDSSGFYDLYNITSRSLPDDLAVLAAWADSGTGLASDCEIPRVGRRGSLGDVATIVVSALSILIMGVLFWRAHRRKAAVGREELKGLFVVYAFYCVFQILTISSLFQQGGGALPILSAIHVAIVPSLIMILLWNGIVGTQVLEDGTIASLAPMSIASVLLFAPTLYIALDTSNSWTSAFQYDNEGRATGLFVLTLLWPAIATVAFLGIMIYVCLRLLHEPKPAVFAGGQVIFFLASQPLCTVSDRKINGTFLATLMNTLSLGLIFVGWVTITEEFWPDDGTTYYG